MTERKRPGCLKKLAVLTISMLLAGVVAELVVVGLLGEQVKFPRHVVGTDFGLRVNLPNSEYRHKSADGTWWFKINGQGMRADHDFAYEKPAGRLRILSLGDSFTIGYEVAHEETFSSVLEAELRAKGYDVEVLNCGVSGYSTAEECLYLERELMKYDPDLVLVSYYNNDVRDNVRTGLFEIDESGVLVQKKDSYVPLGEFANFLNTSTAFSLLSQYSNAFSFAKNETTNLLKQDMVRQEVREAAEERGIDLDAAREEALKAREEREAREAELEAERQAAREERQAEIAARKAAREAKLAAREAEAENAGETAPPKKKRTKPAPESQTEAPESETTSPAPLTEANEEELPQLAPKTGTTQPPVQARQITCELYERIYRGLYDKGIPFVVQSIPYVGESDDDPDLLQVIDAFPRRCFTFDRPGIHFFPAKDVLDPHVNEELLYWTRSNKHWTPFSHRLSGEALAELIDREGLLAK